MFLSPPPVEVERRAAEREQRRRERVLLLRGHAAREAHLRARGGCPAASIERSDDDDRLVTTTRVTVECAAAWRWPGRRAVPTRITRSGVCGRPHRGTSSTTHTHTHKHTHARRREGGAARRGRPRRTIGGERPTRATQRRIDRFVRLSVFSIVAAGPRIRSGCPDERPDDRSGCPDVLTRKALTDDRSGCQDVLISLPP